MAQEANDSKFEEGQRVNHSSYGSGTFRTRNTSSNSNVVVEFDSRGKQVVDERDLQPLNGGEIEASDLFNSSAEHDGLLQNSTVRKDEGSFDGEAVISLTFDEGVEYNVDDLGDGQIAVQYWEEDDE